jgi:hypothetical protein
VDKGESIMNQPNDRYQELVTILARGLIRISEAEEDDNQESEDSHDSDLESSSDSWLSVHTG